MDEIAQLCGLKRSQVYEVIADCEREKEDNAIVEEAAGGEEVLTIEVEEMK